MLSWGLHKYLRTLAWLSADSFYDMTTVVNNPGGGTTERVVESSDSGGWAIAVIILIAVVVVGGLAWMRYSPPVPATSQQPEPGANIQVNLPADTSGDSNPPPAAQ